MKWPISRRLELIRNSRIANEDRDSEPPKIVAPGVADGQVFGFLRVLYERPEHEVQGRHYATRCERVVDGRRCGGRKVVRGADLTAGRVKSCGCLRRDQATRALEEFRNPTPPPRKRTWLEQQRALYEQYASRRRKAA